MCFKMDLVLKAILLMGLYTVHARSYISGNDEVALSNDEMNMVRTLKYYNDLKRADAVRVHVYKVLHQPYITSTHHLTSQVISPGSHYTSQVTSPEIKPALNIINEYTKPFKKTFISADQIQSCQQGLRVATDLTFLIERDNSGHESTVVYLRKGSNHPEVFTFARPHYTDRTTLSFDGKTLTCAGSKTSARCHGLPYNTPVEAFIVSLDINPRKGFAHANQWERNKYTIHESYYQVNCGALIG